MTAILFPGGKVLLLGNYLSRHQTSHQCGMTFRGFCHCMLRIFADFEFASESEVRQSEINCEIIAIVIVIFSWKFNDGTYFSVRQDDCLRKIRGIRRN